MPTKKKTQKITKAPSGISFLFTARAAAKRLRHTWPSDPKHDCKGKIVAVGPQTKTQANRPDAVEYACLECDWISPSGEFQHTPTKRSIVQWGGPTVTKHPRKKMPGDLRDAVRAEVSRRMAILAEERAK